MAAVKTGPEAVIKAVYACRSDAVVDIFNFAKQGDVGIYVNGVHVPHDELTKMLETFDDEEAGDG